MDVRVDNVIPVELAVHATFAIKVAETDEIGVEADDAEFNLFAGEFTSGNGFVQVILVPSSTVDVDTCSDGISCGDGLLQCVYMWVVDIVCSIAVSRDVAVYSFEGPAITQKILHEEGVGTTWDSVDGVAGAHNTVDLSISGSDQKLGGVILGKVLLGDDGIVA